MPTFTPPSPTVTDGSSRSILTTPTGFRLKRTALGRFKHESANCVVNGDGRVVVYSGDDEIFEYIYRFVSRERFDPTDREINFRLLDDGTLSVARFDSVGRLEWIDLIFGQGPLTPENGFNDQGDVLIDTRLAADLVGATRMDRPEEIETDPTTGDVYVLLTNNVVRGPNDVDTANPRAINRFGHILRLLPPGAPGGAADHTARQFAWEVVLLAGNPADSHSRGGLPRAGVRRRLVRRAGQLRVRPRGTSMDSDRPGSQLGLDRIRRRSVGLRSAWPRPRHYQTVLPRTDRGGFALPVFDLYRDLKETKPLLATGMWSVAYFDDMRQRHVALKKRFPDRKETRANPYDGIADLRPETEALLEYYYAARKAAE